MNRCTICDSKLKKSNNASIEILGYNILEKSKEYRKIQTICIDCKTDLLYANIISPFRK